MTAKADLGMQMTELKREAASEVELVLLPFPFPFPSLPSRNVVTVLPF